MVKRYRPRDMQPPSRAYSRYVLAVMFLLTALNVMDRQVLAVLAEPVKLEFGLSDAQMGVLMGSAFGFAHVVAMVPAGRLADIGSRRNVIAAGLFLWSVLTTLTGAARVTWHLFATRIGVGIFETAGTGPAQSLLADYFPVSRRGVALSVHAAGGTFGAMAGFAIGGAVADLVGWRWTFVWFGVPGIVLAGIVLATVREPARGGADGQLTTEPAPSIAAVFRYFVRLRTFRHLLVAGALNSMANWALLAWAAAAMMRGHDMTLTEAGARVGFSVTLFSALGVVAAGLATDRLGRRDLRWYLWWPALASAGAFPFLAAFLLLPDPEQAFLVAIPGAFLNTMWVGTFNASLQLLAHPHMRGTAASFYTLVTSGLIGQGLGPATVGFLSDWMAPQYGPDALRYALTIAIAVSLWAAIHGLLAARTLLAERAGAAD